MAGGTASRTCGVSFSSAESRVRTDLIRQTAAAAGAAIDVAKLIPDHRGVTAGDVSGRHDRVDYGELHLRHVGRHVGLGGLGLGTGSWAAVNAAASVMKVRRCISGLLSAGRADRAVDARSVASLLWCIAANYEPSPGFVTTRVALEELEPGCRTLPRATRYPGHANVTGLGGCKLCASLRQRHGAG